VTVRQQTAFWIGALLLLLVFLWLLSGILLPFIVAAGLAYILDPVADRLQRAGMSRFWATITILIATIVIFALLLLIAVPILVNQFAGFVEKVPAYIAQLRGLADQLLRTRLGRLVGAEEARSGVEQVATQATAWIGTVLASVWAGGRAIVNVVGLTVVTPVVAFYLLYDWDRMMQRFDGLMPRDHVATVRDLAHQIDRAMAGFIRGQGTVCLILGVFYALSLTLVGLNFGFLIGSVAGLIGFIPFVGSIVGFVLSVGVALFQFWPDWPWIVAVGGIFAFGQFLEGNFLQPRLVGSSVGVHPVWLMFALFAFGALFGFVGLLLAVPATAAIGVLVRFAIGRYERSKLYRGESSLTLPPSDPRT